MHCCFSINLSKISLRRRIEIRRIHKMFFLQWDRRRIMNITVFIMSITVISAMIGDLQSSFFNLFLFCKENTLKIFIFRLKCVHYCSLFHNPWWFLLVFTCWSNALAWILYFLIFSSLVLGREDKWRISLSSLSFSSLILDPFR